jgi:aryl-alcohol dehydrogenase-like predicted oxidoreductase
LSRSCVYDGSEASGEPTPSASLRGVRPPRRLVAARGRDQVATVIVGASSEAQLTTNLQAADLTLPTEQRERLDRVSRPDVPYPQWMQRFHDKDRL